MSLLQLLTLKYNRSSFSIFWCSKKCFSTVFGPDCAFFLDGLNDVRRNYLGKNEPAHGDLLKNIFDEYKEVELRTQ